MSLTEEQLIDRLAHVSHQTWMRQDARKKAGEDSAPPPDPLDPTPTEHDRERARDIVTELKELGALDSAP
jgi:hypothetical protein